MALCNVLQRPIHVYELANDNDNNNNNQNRFVLRRMACFGSPKFDKRSALHILSADSRFPDLQPGRQLASGNHFLAMFPTLIGDEEKKKKTKKGAKLRGGGNNDPLQEDDDDEDFDEDYNPLTFRGVSKRWLARLWTGEHENDR